MTNSRSRTGLYSLILKKTSETTTSDDSVNTDAELTVPLLANKTYSFQCMIIVNAHATPDFKYTFTGPSGSTGFYANGSPTSANSLALATFTTEQVVGGSAADTFIFIWGTCQNASTAGNLNLQWSQNTSDANDTIVKKGSYLMVMQE